MVAAEVVCRQAFTGLPITVFLPSEVRTSIHTASDDSDDDPWGMDATEAPDAPIAAMFAWYNTASGFSSQGVPLQLTVRVVGASNGFGVWGAFKSAVGSACGQEDVKDVVVSAPAETTVPHLLRLVFRFLQLPLPPSESTTSHQEARYCHQELEPHYSVWKMPTWSILVEPGGGTAQALHSTQTLGELAVEDGSVITLRAGPPSEQPSRRDSRSSSNSGVGCSIEL
eukprot:TRINITY_DN8558_c0_g1_i1.p1 TRINITY_DN8558_c0_g1~~TRINITY_DN8558_c0_g1_i1.p1  ORF type:complete len:226 (-),score=26.36 TRINITY_DN8558_c0_g1_i1:10-687(-)